MDTAEAHKRFLQAFSEAYAARLASEPGVLDRYSGADWTRVMLGDRGDGRGILGAAAISYAGSFGEPCSLHAQWYTLDLSVVTPPCQDKTEYWQTRSVVAIEHENGDHVETEMWKLAHWRATLSVCVFYDFNEGKHDAKIYRGDKTVGEVARRDWLARKLQLLSAVVQRIDPESGERHLLIVGDRRADRSLRWRASNWKAGAFADPTEF